MKLPIDCSIQMFDADGNPVYGNSPANFATLGFMLSEALLSDRPCSRWNALERMAISRKVRGGGVKQFSNEAIVSLKELANAAFDGKPLLLSQVLEGLGDEPKQTDVE